ncbi:hypothetical protein FRX31_034009 [Thalictrum thalictroides]|uniref:Uncharacterized protein n=1 Tax=Thalictrum thalictroides TaxID=46969 RepID=A0A7J6UUZ6_THATH|nr:hypothetical protein FRX31_034009 [Thalictrum thalictroides]
MTTLEILVEVKNQIEIPSAVWNGDEVSLEYGGTSALKCDLVRCFFWYEIGSSWHENKQLIVYFFFPYTKTLMGIGYTIKNASADSKHKGEWETGKGLWLLTFQSQSLVEQTQH